MNQTIIDFVERGIKKTEIDIAHLKQRLDADQNISKVDMENLSNKMKFWQLIYKLVLEYERKNNMVSEDRCIACGDVVPEGRQVCGKCEAKSAVILRSKDTPKRDRHFCPSCNTRLCVGVKYCWNCGQKMDWGDTL